MAINTIIQDPNNKNASIKYNPLGVNSVYPTTKAPTNTIPTNQTKNNGLMGNLINRLPSNVTNALAVNVPTTNTTKPLASLWGGDKPYNTSNQSQLPALSKTTNNQIKAPTPATYNPNTGQPLKVGETATKDGITYTGTSTTQTTNQSGGAGVGTGTGVGVGTGNGAETGNGAGTKPTTYSSSNPPTVGSTSATLANLINNPSPAVQAAQDALQKFKANVAEQTRQTNTSGTWTGRALGQEQQYGTQNAAIEASLQGALDNALKQQEQAIGALESAQGAVAPQAYGITTTPYNPATGTYGTMAGTTTGTAGLQAAGNVAAQVGIGQNVGTLNSYLGGAQTVGKQLTDLITANNLNPSDVQVINGAIQWLQSGVLSDPKYQELTGQINDFVSSIAPILGTGGSVTDMKTQMSAALVNAKANGQSINDVVNYFLDSAKQKIQGYQTGGGAGYGTTGTTGNSIYDF